MITLPIDIIVSIALLCACLCIKIAIGEKRKPKEMDEIDEKEKHKGENEVLYKVLKFTTDFTIDVIPIIGYYIISLISYSDKMSIEVMVGKVIICSLIMIAVICIEAVIRKGVLSLWEDGLKKFIDYLFVFGLIVLSFIGLVILYIVINNIVTI